MNKGELIEKMAEISGLTKKDAGQALEAFIEAIETSLKSKDKVTIPGFGVFDISERKARTGRNPQTGAEIKIPAMKSPKFKVGKSFKDLFK